MATANAVRKRDAKLHRRRNTVHNHTATVQSETDSATSYESITSNLLDEPSSFSQVLLTKFFFENKSLIILFQDNTETVEV